MSKGNVGLTHRVIEAFNRRDLAGYLELVDRNVEFTPYEVWVQGGNPYRGHTGVKTWWEDSFAVLPDLKAEIYEVRDFGEKTLLHDRLRAQGAGRGAPVERPLWLAITWRGGKGVWWCAFGSEAEALEAAGLED